MSRNYCCNDSFSNSFCNHSNSGLFGTSLWILAILIIFGGSGSGNCNFWDGYCNAFSSSAFNTSNSINSNFSNNSSLFSGNGIN